MRGAPPWLAVTLATAATALLRVQAADLRVRVVNGAGLPLANAIVYAVPAIPIPHGKLPSVIIDQIHRQFAPQVSVVQTGTAVVFPNSDNIRHSVYSFSPAKVFLLKLYAGRAAPPVVFDQAGLVVLGCEIHDTMVAWLLVVSTPYYGKSNAAGLVTLRDLRVGNYRLYAWHVPMRQSTAAQSLDVRPRAPVSAITIRLDVSGAAPDGPPMSMSGMSH